MLCLIDQRDVTSAGNKNTDLNIKIQIPAYTIKKDCIKYSFSFLLDFCGLVVQTNRNLVRRTNSIP